MVFVNCCYCGICLLLLLWYLLIVLFVCVLELWIEFCQHYMDIRLKTLIVFYFALFISVDNVSHSPNLNLTLNSFAIFLFYGYIF